MPDDRIPEDMLAKWDEKRDVGAGPCAHPF